tara:strand:- start:171 stop:452 length:282 start_codon:yes stop_codon:yes gene_type:complete
MRSRYGLTLEQVADMILDQNCACAICGANDRDLVVDHCHVSNNIRGMLCNPCNLALGKFGDNIHTLENAIKYLKHHENERQNSENRKSGKLDE